MEAGNLTGAALDTVVGARDHGFFPNYVDHIRRADLSAGICSITLFLCRQLEARSYLFFLPQ